MNMTAEAGIPLGSSDAELVANSLRGNRDAFGLIVARYQSLVCSLAYSSTGSLTQSEDLAQETFAAAWKQLSGLREPAKLRSWLCGMVRNLSYRSRRGLGREPAHEAEPMETLDKMPAQEPHPAAQAISREEEGILWRSLERIPETYREPLILFYRQHESIEHVALALELSEEAVRQRLTRGRKLLHEEVLAFVEGSLEKTSPGRAFTQGVMAGLPVMAASAKATALGATLGTGAAAKSAATLGTVGGWFAMVASALVSARTVADDAKSPREQKFVFSLTGLLFGLVFLYMAVTGALVKFAFPHAPFGPDSRLTVGYLWPDIRLAIANFLFCVLLVALNLYRSHRQQQIQVQEKTFDENDWQWPKRGAPSAAELSGGKSNRNLKAAKIMAPAWVIVAVTLSQVLPWKHRLGQAMMISAIVALVLFLVWRLAVSGMKIRPRFIGWTDPQFAILVGVSILIGSLTLYSFSYDQRTARAYPGVFRSASPAEVSTFNLVVFLAYALLIGGILWLRKRHGSKF